MATKEQHALAESIYAEQHKSDNAPPEGFIRALLGTSVKNGKGKDAETVDYVFAAPIKDSKGNLLRVASISDLEVLVPVKLDAARKAAENASTNRVTVLHNGKYVDYPLEGEVAAIVTAYFLFLEGLRARLRSGKFTEEQIRAWASQITSFSLPDVSAPVVSEDEARERVAAAIMAGEDPVAALRAMGIVFATSKAGA